MREIEEKKGVKAFLGTGWKFPVSIDGAAGRIRMSSNEENIEDSVRLIIGTRKGERVMEPEFGCRIWEYSFETLNYTTLHAMKNEVESALIRWEPRITDIQVDIDDEKAGEGLLLIHVSYMVRSTNNLYNMVYPFYINEGE